MLWRLVIVVAAVLALLAVVAWRASRDARVREALERLEALSWRERARVGLAVAQDPRVPLVVRVLPLLLAAYLVFPIDLIPDFIPVIGQLDDLLLVAVVLWVVIRAIPPGVFEAHLPAEDDSGDG
jgi:uncharacterized membrane protein YkvA (DUF1232 family)